MLVVLYPVFGMFVMFVLALSFPDTVKQKTRIKKKTSDKIVKFLAICMYT